MKKRYLNDGNCKPPPFTFNQLNERNGMDSTNVVFRQFALPVATFDYFKECQRSYERKHGVRLNNNQLLVVLLAEHEAINGDSVEHGTDNRQ